MRRFLASGGWGSLGIGLLFFGVATLLLLLRAQTPAWRAGDTVSQPLRARADFVWLDRSRLELAQAEARETEPRHYRPSSVFSWQALEEELKHLPEVVAGKTFAELPSQVRASLDSAAVLTLSHYSSAERRAVFAQCVEAMLRPFSRAILLPPEHREEELQRQTAQRLAAIEIVLSSSEGPSLRLPLDRTHPAVPTPQFSAELAKSARTAFEGLGTELPLKLADYVLRQLKPTHVLDPQTTLEAQDRAAAMVRPVRGEVAWKAGAVIKGAGAIHESDLPLLTAEHKAYLSSLPEDVRWRSYAGLAGTALVITALLCWYIARFQPRILRNHARAAALAALLLGMLITAQLAAEGSRPIFFFGIGPTVVVTMITAIAYDRRFAMGIGILHSVLVTLALGQDVAFLFILFSGVCVATAMLGNVRTRGRLIEAGVLTGATLAAATLALQASSVLQPQPLWTILTHAFYAGLAALSSGFVVLGILPFVEKTFRITSGMTLIELANAGHPLQRRLANEAPGTYSHSLQVAALAESCAEAIGADSLLVRAGALYHDVGKIRKPEFFCENQGQGGNRHLSLSAEVSLQIILAHVRDGIQLAREYKLPTGLHSFIQQHHGTTLVEYFYHQAKTQSADAPPDHEDFRYAGPKPRSREAAILMLCDACESACRALTEPSPQNIERLVHELVLKRVVDQQFTDCELTLQELAIVERAIVRGLMSLHHSRVAYPSTGSVDASAAAGGGAAGIGNTSLSAGNTPAGAGGGPAIRSA
jgi:putative nucleotidyltransferase with HDIG domain